MMETIPVQTSSLPTQLVMAGEGQTLLFNNDIVNSVVLSDVIGINPGQTSTVAPLGPLESLVVDGHRDVYAAPVPANATVQVVKIPGGMYLGPSPSQSAASIAALGLATATNQSTQITHESNVDSNTNLSVQALFGTALGTPSALVGASGLTISKDMLHANTGVTTEIASLIATGSAAGSPGGVPLLNGSGQLGIGNAISLPASGAFVTEGPFTITQPGYELWVSLAYASSTPSGAPTSCTLIWRDATTLDKIEVEQFDLFPGASTGNAHIMTFKGPSKTSQVLIQFSNSDTLSAVNMSYVFWQNSRVLPRSIGKTIQIPTQFAASTYFSAFGNPSRNIIGEYTNASLAAANSVFIITSVYNGDCDLILCSGSGVNPPLSIQGYPVDNVGIAPPLYNAYQQTTNGIHEVISLSRAEMVWIIKNNDTVNAHAVNFSLIAKEQGS